MRLMAGWLVINEFETMSKKAVLSYIHLLSRNASDGTEENHKNPHSR
jgi:hypothetical protein